MKKILRRHLQNFFFGILVLGLTQMCHVFFSAVIFSGCGDKGCFSAFLFFTIILSVPYSISYLSVVLPLDIFLPSFFLKRSSFSNFATGATIMGAFCLLLSQNFWSRGKDSTESGIFMAVIFGIVGGMVFLRLSQLHKKDVN
jgi:hypothetical protein